MTDLRKSRLDAWWQDKLNSAMEKHYPKIIEAYSLVDAWKRDGWNDGTTTLFGVYQFGTQYRMCSFPDYGEPENVPAQPKFEHTGWYDPSKDKEPDQ